MKRSRNYFTYCFLFTLSIFLAIIGHVSGQISAPGSNFSDTIYYPAFTGVDMYHIFFTPEHSASPVYGTLNAVAPKGTAGWDFEWSMYYFEPLSSIIHTRIEEGQHIGYAQDISLKYPGIIPHVHFQIDSINPEILMRLP